MAELPLPAHLKAQAEGVDLWAAKRRLNSPLRQIIEKRSPDVPAAPIRLASSAASGHRNSIVCPLRATTRLTCSPSRLPSGSSGVAARFSTAFEFGICNFFCPSEFPNAHFCGGSQIVFVVDF